MLKSVESSDKYQKMVVHSFEKLEEFMSAFVAV